MEHVKGGMLAKVPEEIQLEMKKLEPDLSPSAWAMKYATDLDGVMPIHCPECQT